MVSVAQLRPDLRARFIRKTYLHLAVAVAAFIAVEFFLFTSGIAGVITQFVMGSRFAWLAILGGFSLLGWMSRSFAAKADSVGTQYIGLGLYVIGQALLFTPLIYVAAVFYDASVLVNAALLTLFLFAGITMIAFTTRQDFSFLGGILKIGGFVALGLIVCSILFGFTLGLLFSVVMVVFASVAILYDTSNVIHYYSENQYVAASLQLFASIALLFWYILRIFMSSRR